MNDIQFQWGMIAAALLTIIWICAGIIWSIFSGTLVIIIGLIVWIAVSGLLIHYWGKNYMSRE